MTIKQKWKILTPKMTFSLEEANALVNEILEQANPNAQLVEVK